MQRLKCSLLVKRAAAHTALGDFAAACQDYSQALDTSAGADVGDDVRLDYERVQHLYARVLHESADTVTLTQAESLQSSGDIQGACSAFSEALTLNPNSIAAWMGRARCLQLQGQYLPCVNDCTMALMLLEEAGTFADQSVTARLLVLRAGANACLGQSADSLTDCGLALSLLTSLSTLPGTVSADQLAVLTAECQSIQLACQARTMRAAADEAYRQDRMGSALDAYARAISMLPNDPLAYLNRAACLLKSEDYSKCIRDCDSAIALIRTALLNAGSGVPPGVPISLLSELALKAWLRTGLIRRGSARCFQGHLTEGRADYVEASQLLNDSENATPAEVDEGIALLEDIERIDAAAASADHLGTVAIAKTLSKAHVHTV